MKISVIFACNGVCLVAGWLVFALNVSGADLAAQSRCQPTKFIQAINFTRALGGVPTGDEINQQLRYQHARPYQNPANFGCAV